MITSDTFNTTSALVVGDVMLDRYWIGTVDRISPEAPVPIVAVRREDERPGGAANVAWNIRSLGVRTGLIGAVGVDEAADRLGKLLDQHDIFADLCADPALSTTLKLRVSGQAQQLLRIDFEGRPGVDVLAAVARRYADRLEHYDTIIFSDYDKGGLANIEPMVQQAQKLGKRIVVDPKGVQFDRYSGATIVTPNQAEFARVAGSWSSEADFEQRATAMRERLGLEALLITRSEEGMSLFDAQGHFRIATTAQTVFDVTGAGDTVVAVLAAALGGGVALREAALLANRAAGIVVSRFGAAHVSVDDLVA